MLTAQEAKRIFIQDQATGDLMWLAPGRQRVPFTRAGTITASGYREVKWKGRTYKAHRIIWLLAYGVWPEEIDHINRDKADNRLLNLRLATRLQNTQNRPVQKNNRSGVSGVGWKKSAGKWVARIKIPGKFLFLGLHDDLELAELIVSEARRKFFGDFAPNFKAS